MLERRKCPNCGTDWYSANRSREWTCDYCKTKIPTKDGTNEMDKEPCGVLQATPDLYDS